MKWCAAMCIRELRPSVSEVVIPSPWRSNGNADPDFLYAALDTTACAAFIKESRMNFADANNLHRKSGQAIMNRT
jgi:hypothetical protein